MTPLADEIEIWLLAQYGWVSEKEICRRFGVDERKLRSTKTNPGLLSEIAVSSNNGFKHVTRATQEEWENFSIRIRGGAVNSLLRLKRLGEKRKNILTGKRPAFYEKFTGQGRFV